MIDSSMKTRPVSLDLLQSQSPDLKGKRSSVFFDSGTSISANSSPTPKYERMTGSIGRYSDERVITRKTKEAMSNKDEVVIDELMMEFNNSIGRRSPVRIRSREDSTLIATPQTPNSRLTKEMSSPVKNIRFGTTQIA